jgi:excisionase family DNA binding protein
MPDKLIITTAAELLQMIKDCLSLEMQKITGVFKPAEISKGATSEYCFIAEASEITGLAKSTIRTKCHLGEMPYYKPVGTKMLKFKRSELEAWVEGGKIKTTNEMNEINNEYLTSKRSKK